MTLAAIWYPVITLEDAEVVRNLRNLGREWFADNHLITKDEQATWWASMRALSRKDFTCMVLAVPKPPCTDPIRTGTVVGYGMLTRRDDRLWVSLVVSAGSRGLGWGRRIYEDLRRSAQEPIFAAIRHDNIASRRAAEGAGFVLTSEVAAPGVPPEIATAWPVLRGDKIVGEETW